MIIRNVDWDAFIEAYITGKSMAQLCRENRIDSRSAARKLKKRGIPLRTASEARKLSMAEQRVTRTYPVHEIAKDYAAGMPLRDITRKYRMHARTFRRLMKTAQVDLRDLSSARTLIMSSGEAGERAKRAEAMRAGWYRWREKQAQARVMLAVEENS